MSYKIQDHKNSFHEKSLVSAICHHIQAFPFCNFDFDTVFEIGCEYQRYFPSNNLSNVMKKFNSI